MPIEDQPRSESPEEAGVPPESTGCGAGCDGCGTCAGCKCGGPLTPAYQDGCGETTGCDPKTASAQKRQWIVLASFCLSLIAFILNTVDASYNKYTVWKRSITLGGFVGQAIPVSELAHGGFGKDDKILTAGFGFNTMIFILAFFVMKGAPSCSVSLCEKLPARLPRSGHGEWRNTFALHSLVAAILHTAYMIEAAQYQVNRNMDCRDAKELLASAKQELPGPTIAAIVFAACNCGLLYYLTFCFMTDKLKAVKNAKKDLLCLVALILTVVCFSCWLHSPITDAYWMNAVVIAASVLAALACVDGIAFADSAPVEGSEGKSSSMSFAFNSMIACLLFFIFLVGAAVDIPDQLKDAKIITSMVAAAANSVVLFLMGQSTSKATLLERSREDKILVGITLFSITQFSIAAYEWQLTGATPPQAILSLGIACVITADLFHAIFPDIFARGFHLLIATLSYIIYFIYECVETADYFRDLEDANAALTDDQAKTFRTRTTALVFAAANVVLLALATYFMFPKATNQVADEESAENK